LGKVNLKYRIFRPISRFSGPIFVT